jgi:hypothetical protein
MEATMSNPRFDAFGEPMLSESVRAPGRASSWLLRAGTSAFWLLVAGIVIARATYFEAGVFNFDHAVAWAQGLFAAL